MSTDANALVVVPPLAITDSILIVGSPPATNVPENDYPEYRAERGKKICEICGLRCFSSRACSNHIIILHTTVGRGNK